MCPDIRLGIVKSCFIVVFQELVNAMINNSDHFKTICRLLNYSFEEQMSRTATDEQWGGEVQIHALSIALCQPIYSYVK